MKVIIPDMDALWEDKWERETILEELFAWADAHTIMLYFDERPDMPTECDDPEQITPYYEQITEGQFQGSHVRWPDESKS